MVIKVSKDAKIRNRYNQVPHLSQDTTWESDKNTIKHTSQESQDASPFPAGDHKAAMNRQESICLFLFDLILYIPSTIFQLNRDGSSCVEQVLR